MTASRNGADGPLVGVAIGTTRGPSVVLRIAEEAPEVRSVVCLGRTTRALPISPAYDAFTRRPTGVIERELGHGAFRADVSARIDGGESWQLGFYLAHRLAAAGRLAGAGETPGRWIWATGALDGELAIGPVAEVARKLANSADWLAARTREGAAVAVVAPEDAARLLEAADLPAGATAMAESGVERVLAGIGLPPPAAAATAGARRPERAAPPRPGGRKRRRAATAAALALVLAGAGAAVWAARLPPFDPLPDRAAPGPSAAAPAAAPAVAIEWRVARPAPGGDCGGPAGPEEPAAGATVEGRACRLVAAAVNRSDAAVFVELAAGFSALDHIRPGRRRADIRRGAVAPGGRLELPLVPPERIGPGFAARAVALAAPAGAEGPERAAASLLDGRAAAPAGGARTVSELRLAPAGLPAPAP